MKFTCPQKDHNITFTSAWDYLTHLQKCRFINSRLSEYGETRNEFYFCASCLQVFELITERDMHQTQCKNENFKQIFKDVNKSIPLGKKGNKKIQELISHYKELLQPQKKSLLDQMQFIQENQQEIPTTTDPRLYVPKVGLDTLKGNQIQKVNKLVFNLLGGYEKMEAAYYKFFKNISTDQIVKEFPFKITTDSFKSFCQKNKIEMSKQLLMDTRVCEFCEMKIMKNPEIFLQIIQTNRAKSIWLMIPETENPVSEFEFQEPWCIFNILTDQYIEQKQIENIQEKPQNAQLIQLERQLKAEEEKSQILQQQLKQSFFDVDQTLNFVTQKKLRIDSQETQLSTLLIKLREVDLASQSVIRKYQALNVQKLSEAEIHLNNFFQKQQELERRKNTQVVSERNIPDEYNKKKNRLKAKVVQLDKDRDALVNKINFLKQQIQFTHKSIEEKIAKASHAKRKIQMIKQLLCISCQTKEREVIQFPCQHFLFCEECFQKKQSQQGFKCPLQSLLKCQNEEISSKYKIIKIANID